MASGVGAFGDDAEAATALRRHPLTHSVRDRYFRNTGLALALEQELGARFRVELGEAYASAARWAGQVVRQPPHPMAA